MTKQLKYIPELDGLRGIAVLLVFLSHVGVHPFLEGGGAGISIFFALSGFLITALLIGEKDRTGAINFIGFYRRRFLRLMPALLCVAVPVYLAGMLTDFQLLAILLYFGNFLRLAGNTLGWLHHGWSLAIEEQFYLLWPLLFSWYLPQRRKMYIVLLFVAFLSLSIWRAYLWHQSGSIVRVHFGTDVNFPELLAGCLAALLWQSSKGVKGTAIILPLSLALLLLASGILRWLPGGDGYWIYSQQATFGYSWPIVSAITALFILYLLASESTWVHRLLCCRPLVYMGKISYGFYLFHLPIIYTVRHLFPTFTHPGYLFPLIVLVSDMSYRWIEKRFLDYRGADRNARYSSRI